MIFYTTPIKKFQNILTLLLTLQTSYDAGSGGITFPSDLMAALDNELVPLIHGQVAPTTHSFELVFYVLDY